jgi:hypothetical protein
MKLVAGLNVPRPALPDEKSGQLAGVVRRGAGTPAYGLSVMVAVLAAIASAGGLFLPELYRDSDFIRTAWFGNDLVTLLLVVPMLAVALYLARRGSGRAQLVWMGLLGYMVYNYAFYLFGAVFNWFFLLYVALFALSVYALITGLAALNVNAISRRFRPQTPVLAISGFLLFISLPLAVIEAGQCIRFIVDGTVPEAPSLIFALDLAVVVPNTALAAVLLFKRRPWGYVLATMMLVKAFTYGLVLSLATAMIAGFRWSGTWDPLMPFYVLVALGGLVAGWVLLKNLRTDNLY